MTALATAAEVDAPEQPRVLRVLVGAQILSGAGLAAGITVGALLAQDMLGSTAFAGIPTLLFTSGAATAALAVGAASQRLGRRVGLAGGYAAGALGSAGVVLAAVLVSPVLLLVALFIYGAGSAANLQARYAGSDLAAPHRRGRALSIVLLATTGGAVAGPNLARAMGNLAESWSIPYLAGPFILAGAAYGLGSIVLWVFLRPDPLLVARSRAAAAREAAGEVSRSPVAVLDRRNLALGAVVMVVAQLVMIAIMTMTPVHMIHHGHGVDAVGVVIGIHVAAMFLPSPLSGWLVDRFGARAVAAASAVTFIASGVMAMVVPAGSTPLLAVALALLGLAWSFGLVSGTALVTHATPLDQRARVQGRVDFLIALAGASGGAVSGVVVAQSSFAWLGFAGAIVALLLLPALLLTRGSRRDGVGLAQ